MIQSLYLYYIGVIFFLATDLQLLVGNSQLNFFHILIEIKEQISHTCLKIKLNLKKKSVTWHEGAFSLLGFLPCQVPHSSNPGSVHAASLWPTPLAYPFPYIATSYKISMFYLSGIIYLFLRYQ